MAIEIFDLSLYLRIAHGVFAARAIDAVARYRMARVSQMHPDLMRAARLYLHIQQGEFIVTLADFKNRMRGAARPTLKHSHASAIARAASDGCGYLSAIHLHAPVDQSRVHLEYAAITELIR